MKRNIIILAALLCGVGIGIGIGTAGLPGASAQAGIDNPEAIRWVNEVIRPLAENYRATNIMSEQALAQWYGGMNTLFPNDSTALEDGREAEGVSRLTGADINSFMGQVATLVGQFDGGGVVDVINKPCVRMLEVQ